VLVFLKLKSCGASPRCLCIAAVPHNAKPARTGACVHVRASARVRMHAAPLQDPPTLCSGTDRPGRAHTVGRLPVSAPAGPAGCPATKHRDGPEKCPCVRSWSCGEGERGADVRAQVQFPAGRARACWEDGDGAVGGRPGALTHTCARPVPVAG